MVTKVVASNQKAKEILGWELKNSDLENIINSAWQWEKIREKFND